VILYFALGVGIWWQVIAFGRVAFSRKSDASGEALP
jgi:hypothetical protein